MIMFLFPFFLSFLQAESESIGSDGSNGSEASVISVAETEPDSRRKSRSLDRNRSSSGSRLVNDKSLVLSFPSDTRLSFVGP